MTIAQIEIGRTATQASVRRPADADRGAGFGNLLQRPEKIEDEEPVARSRFDETRPDERDDEDPADLVGLLSQMQTATPTAQKPKTGAAGMTRAVSQPETGTGVPDRQVLAAAADGKATLHRVGRHLRETMTEVSRLGSESDGDGSDDETGATPVDGATAAAILAPPVMPLAPPAAIEAAAPAPAPVRQAPPAGLVPFDPIVSTAVAAGTPDVAGATDAGTDGDAAPADGAVSDLTFADIVADGEEAPAGPRVPAAAALQPVRAETTAPIAALALASSPPFEEVGKPADDAIAALPDQPLPIAAPAPVAAKATVELPKLEGAPQVDTAHADWIEAMIERVAEMRDIAGAGGKSTMIRLLPDALGAVDIRIEQRDGAATQVSFVADNPQARAMLADAAPKLVEMAEARGLKFEQANVGGGEAGTRQSQTGAQGQPQPQIANLLPGEPAEAAPATPSMRRERIA